jgi:hypothetical protein
MKAEDYSRRQIDVAGWTVWVETYRVGEMYYCAISNTEAGARFARAEGRNRERAEETAIEKASRYLALTRKFKIEE